MYGSAAVPQKMFRAISSFCTSFAGRDVRRPSRKPAPCAACTGPTRQDSRISADICCTFCSRPSLSMMSMTVSTIAQASGPPPNVVPMSSILSLAATPGASSIADTGTRRRAPSRS
jgi:hypothetical protein